MTTVTSVRVIIALQVKLVLIILAQISTKSFQVASTMPTALRCTLCVEQQEITSVAVTQPLSVRDTTPSVTFPRMITASGVLGPSVRWVSGSNPYKFIHIHTGCSSDANCPADRPVCGAGAGSGSGTDGSHLCGCFVDGDCSDGKICEAAVCIEGCRSRSKWKIKILANLSGMTLSVPDGTKCVSTVAVRASAPSVRESSVPQVA